MAFAIVSRRPILFFVVCILASEVVDKSAAKPGHAIREGQTDSANEPSVSLDDVVSSKKKTGASEWRMFSDRGRADSDEIGLLRRPTNFRTGGLLGLSDSALAANSYRSRGGDGEFVVDFGNGKVLSSNDINEDDLPASNETLQGYIRKNCSRCLVREEAKQIRLEQIQRDLLDKLGLRFAPNITKRDLPSLPNTGSLNGVLRSLGFASDQPYRKPWDDETYKAKTERIFTIAVTPPFLNSQGEEATAQSGGSRSPSQHDFAYFQFSPETLSSQLEKAHLHFYLRRPANFVAENSQMPTLIRVQLLRVTDISNPRMPKLELLETKELKATALRWHGHWERFDVKKLVNDWFNKPSRNHGLTIRAIYEDENLVEFPETSENKHTMYIDLVTQFGHSSRAKREAASHRLDCTVQSQESRCCRYPLVVDFEKFGWDWVIAPKRYYAHYCSGDCPLRFLQSNLHTHLAQQMGGNAGPCCTAADVAPIQMIYFNENKEILIAKVPGMVVTRCACA